MNPRSQKAAEFVSELLHGVQFDHVVKQAVRHQQSLEEVLEHRVIDKVWKQILADSGSVEAEPVDENASMVSKSSLLVQVLPAESLNKLTQPEHSKTLEVMESAAESARKQVRSQVQTIDGSLSLEKLAKNLRNTQIMKLRGTTETSILVVYMVEAAGEHERDARRSPTPMRRDYMDKVLKAIMSTRGELPDFELEKVVYPQLDPSDT